MTPWAYIAVATISVIGAALIAGQFSAKHRARERLDKESAIYERMEDGPAKTQLGNHIARGVAVYTDADAERLPASDIEAVRQTQESKGRWRLIISFTGIILLVGPLVYIMIINIKNQGKPVSLTGGGCASTPFDGYTANASDQLGASVFQWPSQGATQLTQLGPGQAIQLDAWVTSDPLYPDKTYPFGTPVWFHVAAGGWVSAAELRVDLSANSDVLSGPPNCVGWYDDPNESV